jgi:hypothetical protein
MALTLAPIARFVADLAFSLTDETSLRRAAKRAAT